MPLLKLTSEQIKQLEETRTHTARAVEKAVDSEGGTRPAIYAAALSGNNRFQFQGSSSAMRLAG